MIKELKDRENAFMYGDKPPGMREIVHHYDNTEPLTLEKLKEYLMEIFSKKSLETYKGDVMLHTYCPHQNKYISLSFNPFKTECRLCLEQMLKGPCKSAVHSLHKKVRSKKVRSLN